MNNPLLSIIIVNYNTQALLKQCLESIINPQGKKTKKKDNKNLKTEIIVVDNASTDGSKKMLTELKRQIEINRNMPIALKVIFNKKNLGFAKANNQGIKIAKGKYILLLNSDTIVREEALERLGEFVQKKQDAGVVGPQLLNINGTVQPSCYYLPTLMGAIKEFWLGKQGAFLKYYPRTEKASVVEAVVGAAFLIPRKIIDKVGTLDEQYFMYFEDLDYCRRVGLAGYRVYYLPSAKISHLHGASGKKLASRPNKWLIESSKIYNGPLRYYLISFVIWSAQKLRQVKNKFCPDGKINRQ